MVRTREFRFIQLGTVLLIIALLVAPGWRPSAVPAVLAAPGDIRLTALCSEHPAAFRRWSVENLTASPVTVDWALAGTDQRGTLTIPPYQQGFPVTSTVPGPNTLI